jgi:hypothetical protein
LRPIIAAPDSALTKACALPVDLGAASLTQQQIEKLWITDRARLIACAKRHKALADFIADRDKELQGAK